MIDGMREMQAMIVEGKLRQLQSEFPCVSVFFLML